MTIRRSPLAVALPLALLVGLAGTARASDPPTVFAAASLTESFPKIDPSARYSFAGSNTLALQIRQGAPADVFASAAPNFTQELFRDGLVEKPQVPRVQPARADRAEVEPGRASSRSTTSPAAGSSW